MDAGFSETNWRDIRLTDCDISPRTRMAVTTDHGPAVTLGALFRMTDQELQRSPNVGAKSLREIRQSIATMRKAYPDIWGPKTYMPSTEIDWVLLGRAIEFYKSKGYEYVEAPWAVPDDIVEITAPHESWRIGGRMAQGTLVGSAEQSFLYLDSLGKLPPGRYVACSPCFRPAEDIDDLHAPYFMKIELYSTLDPASPLNQMLLLSHAGQFNHMVLGDSEVENIRAVKTADGIDIELNGIEIGSYGVRKHGALTWGYGTGLALPRFTQARNAR